MERQKTAVITGGSRGIGAAAAKLFREKGYRVFELSRSGQSRDGITHIDVDITNDGRVKEAFDGIIKQCQAIDVLVNNAGYGISGAVETTDIDAAKRQLDVNYFGMLRCIKQAVPNMRENGGGHIVNVSSVAGVLPVPYQSLYSASKSAVNALTLTLANEVKRFNIKVCAVMPGDTATGFTDNRLKNESGDDTYNGSISHAVKAMEKDERAGMRPEKIAGVIFKAACAKNPRPLYTVGGKYRLFTFLNKLLPAKAVNYIEGKLYG
ncbi:MAG: SDR family oxidoreductase [Clostridia bacterium]|nr:SDR family oxidoreductase [Clostridia bacterium]